jgi:hypothetical protein
LFMQDNLGAVTNVSISHMISAGTASAQWVTQTAPSTSEASATASTITFTNLVVPGYAAAGTTTSLTLNGTLNFQPTLPARIPECRQPAEEAGHAKAGLKTTVANIGEGSTLTRVLRALVSSLCPHILGFSSKIRAASA